MPGGNLFIRIKDNWEITMTGEVRQIAQEHYIMNSLKTFFLIHNKTSGNT